MSTDNQIRLTFGKINLPRTSGTLSAWKIEAPFKKTLAVAAGRGIGAPSYMEATTLGKHGGGFTSKNVTFDEGTVLMVQAGSSRGGMPYNSAAMFLRVRSSAAFIIIKYKIPTGTEGMLGDRLVAFNGCADIMTAEQLKVLGYEIARGVVTQYLNPEEQAELFEVQTLRTETSPAPVHARIATSQGVEIKAVAADPVRRMRIRR